MKEKVRPILNKYYTISTDTFEQFYASFELLQVEKGKAFIRKGRRENFEYILVEGICHSFLFSPEGEEVTISFFVDQTVLPPHITRTQKGVSTLNFQTLRDSTFIRFSAQFFEQFMIDNLDVRAWGNEVLKNELALKVEREIDLASLNARERLIKFRHRFPMLENWIPHPKIASYLGITNVSLSRLRKELS